MPEKASRAKDKRVSRLRLSAESLIQAQGGPSEICAGAGWSTFSDTSALLVIMSPVLYINIHLYSSMLHNVISSEMNKQK